MSTSAVAARFLLCHPVLLVIPFPQCVIAPIFAVLRFSMFYCFHVDCCPPLPMVATPLVSFPCTFILLTPFAIFLLHAWPCRLSFVLFLLYLFTQHTLMVFYVVTYKPQSTLTLCACTLLSSLCLAIALCIRGTKLSLVYLDSSKWFVISPDLNLVLFGSI